MAMELRQLHSLIAGAIQASPADDLVSLRAGLCTRQGTTITSDSRKGRLVLIERDGLLHVQWKLRPSNDVQEDYIVMPNEATVELIPECTDGRILLIDFPEDPTRRHFYWLQEPQNTNDAEIIEKLQGYFSGRIPFSGRSLPEDSAAISSRTNLNQNELLALLTGASQQQQQQPTNTSHQVPNQVPVQSLAAVLDPENLIPVLRSHPDIIEALVEYLPQEQRSFDDVLAQLRSPQLHQALNRLTLAINSGQGQSLLQQFGIACDDVGIYAMLEAIIQQFRNNNTST